jgi:TonB family protein
VVVASASGTRDPKFDSYLPRVFVKLEQNWNPPPGVKGAKAKVLFTILRSGRVGDFKLLESSGNFYFDQAAMRTILASSPFPPLPEGFFKDSESFIADLMEKE